MLDTKSRPLNTLSWFPENIVVRCYDEWKAIGLLSVSDILVTYDGKFKSRKIKGISFRPPTDKSGYRILYNLHHQGITFHKNTSVLSYSEEIPITSHSRIHCRIGLEEDTIQVREFKGIGKPLVSVYFDDPVYILAKFESNYIFLKV